MAEHLGLQLSNITLPAWLTEEIRLGQVISDEDARMAVAIRLSERQVEQKTGGPFGALVCELDTGKVVGFGVNRVTESHWSSAHAEFIAWTMAQEVQGGYDLSPKPVGLYTSAQPCVSCWGGMFWTGISRLVYGATKQDVERYAGFDEGPVPVNWDVALKERGIGVRGEIFRNRAVEVLQSYQREGGECYNARR